MNYSDPFGLLECTREKPKECTWAEIGQNILAGFAASSTPGLGEDTGPGFKTGLAGGLLLQALSVRAPSGVGLSEEVGTATGASLTSGLERQLLKHIKKLEDYRANPEAADNLGTLRNAPTPETRQKIIDGRIRSLEKHIRVFEQEIAKRRGIT